MCPGLSLRPVLLKIVFLSTGVNQTVNYQSDIMAGWKLKAIIVAAVTACVLQMIFQRHFKCNMSSVLKELVSTALRF